MRKKPPPPQSVAGKGTFGDPAAPHQPFKDALGGLKKALDQQAEADRKRAQVEAKKPPPPPPAPKLSDDELLALAMSGVKPLAGAQRVVANGQPTQASQRPTQAAAKAPILAEDDEPDWWQGEVDPAFLWSLGGERPWQKRIALQAGEPTGLGKELAAAVRMAREQHLACILLVFGGMRRDNWRTTAGTPGATVRRLLRETLAPRVIGYMTAKPSDGGVNAIYLWVRPQL